MNSFTFGLPLSVLLSSGVGDTPGIGTLESLYFGQGKRLFGTYHPATGQQRGHGVVVCAPLFHEYYRGHFTLRKTAAELAARGFDVLRFDYTGTGDSKGATPADPIDTWSNDIGDALAEIRQLSGCTDVSLITTRFSAALGLPWRDRVRHYVCWDPVTDHRRYADELDALHEATVAEHVGMPAESKRASAQDDFLGVGISRSTIREQIASFAAGLTTLAPAGNPKATTDIGSDVEWPIASLQMIYARDTVNELVGAFQVDGQ